MITMCEYVKMDKLLPPRQVKKKVRCTGFFVSLCLQCRKRLKYAFGEKARGELSSPLYMAVTKKGCESPNLSTEFDKITILPNLPVYPIIIFRFVQLFILSFWRFPPGFLGSLSCILPAAAVTAGPRGMRFCSCRSFP